MGCGPSMTAEQKEAKKRNDDIERLINKDRRDLKNEVKLLLLGTGESGKSTIFKQMKIISAMGGFTKEELANYRFTIYSNCITQMKVLTKYAQTFEEAPENKDGAYFNYVTPNARAAIERFKVLSTDPDSWSPQVAADIELLWNDPGIKRTYDFRDKKFQLNDTAGYFFDNVQRISAPDYMPVPADALRARVRSTGIEEAEFQFENLGFRMVDVGGQRSERRKWIHCFEGVTAVIFCVALIEYDQTLREDESQNRMKESLLLFGEICNSAFFERSAFILFLNKLDLFRDRILRADLSKPFPEYKGGRNEENALKFIRATFEGTSNSNKDIYTHFTIAIDTNNIEVVFACVRELILKRIIDGIFTSDPLY